MDDAGTSAAAGIVFGSQPPLMMPGKQQPPTMAPPPIINQALKSPPPAPRMPGVSQPVRLPPAARQEYEQYVQDRLRQQQLAPAPPRATLVQGVNVVLC